MEDANGNEGEFVYFGLKKKFQNCVDPETHTSDDTELVVHVDGMPLTQSGVKQMSVTACFDH